MTGSAAVPLTYGMLAMGFAVAGTFFLRFWATTRDRLFAMFAAAFWLLAIQRILAIAMVDWFETTTWLYVMRLLAFVIIVVAIVDKNRAAGAPR